MQSMQHGKLYTYSDYLTWDDEPRCELIDGVIYLMSAAPRRVHQEISREIFVQLANFLKGKSCKVYHAPFDVRLNPDGADDTVVQPDIVVVCDSSKLDDAGCRGVPDLVIEILSPTTASYDKVLKFNRYLQAGVREYWIAEPDTKTVSVHILENGKYNITPYGETDTVPVHVLEGCQVTLEAVFGAGIVYRTQWRFSPIE